MSPGIGCDSRFHVTLFTTWLKISGGAARWALMAISVILHSYIDLREKGYIKFNEDAYELLRRNNQKGAYL